MNRCANLVEEYRTDPEAAHAAEDELLMLFVGSIAEESVPDPAESAAAIYGGLLLVPRKRWYA